jgi:hypothetical protein
MVFNHSIPSLRCNQGVTKKCCLSLLTNSVLVYESLPMRGDGGGGGVARSQPMSTALAHHVTWSPNKLWSTEYIFLLELKQGFFLFTSIYSNTLVHSSPHLPVYCMGRWVRLHCFFQMGILDMIQHFMHEILVGSSHYFTSYYNERP